jgi:hypothetical protein
MRLPVAAATAISAAAKAAASRRLRSEDDLAGEVAVATMAMAPVRLTLAALPGPARAGVRRPDLAGPGRGGPVQPTRAQARARYRRTGHRPFTLVSRRTGGSGQGLADDQGAA